MNGFRHSVQADLSRHTGCFPCAKFELTYTKNPQIRKIAKNIIKDQAKEIKQFDKLIEQGL